MVYLWWDCSVLLYLQLSYLLFLYCFWRGDPNCPIKWPETNDESGSKCWNDPLLSTNTRMDWSGWERKDGVMMR